MFLEYVALASAAQEATWIRQLTAVLKNRPHETYIFLGQPICHLYDEEPSIPRSIQAHLDQVSFHQRSSQRGNCEAGVLPDEGDRCRHDDQRTVCEVEISGWSNYPP